MWPGRWRPKGERELEGVGPGPKCSRRDLDTDGCPPVRDLGRGKPPAVQPHLHFLNPVLLWVADRLDAKHQMRPVGAVDEETQIGSVGGYRDAALGRFAPPSPETAGLQRKSPHIVHAEAIESNGEVTAESLPIEVVAGDEVVARRPRVDCGEGPVGTKKYPGCRGNAAGDEQ